MKFIEKTGPFVETYISQSAYIFIAVALASEAAIKLLDKRQKKCKIKCVVGIDLPTPLKVLKRIKDEFKGHARIYNSEMFHPKVYIFELKDGTQKAILGSGNFTNGGLHNNIEASILIDEPDTIAELKNWFQKIYIQSQPITKDFLNKYKEYTNSEEKHLAQRKRHLKRLQTSLDIYANVRKDTIHLLSQEMRKGNFSQNIHIRQTIVKQLQKIIDFTNHFKDFDVDEFYKIPQLGKIPPLYKSYLKEAKLKGDLARLLDMLTDDCTPIFERFDNTTDKKYKIKGIDKNFISKILCCYNPDSYLIWNEITESFFAKIGLSPDKGLSRGEQYQFYCEFFKGICRETQIPNMAILDELIFEIMEHHQ